MKYLATSLTKARLPIRFESNLFIINARIIAFFQPKTMTLDKRAVRTIIVMIEELNLLIARKRILAK